MPASPRQGGNVATSARFLFFFCFLVSPFVFFLVDASPSCVISDVSTRLLRAPL
ncbi:unnamed protein product [Amoebophrya sp. A25]|nr:unnamed protein product [Amoebophrya sp. A25]|eukprot:GSA25T00015632001.1